MSEEDNEAASRRCLAETAAVLQRLALDELDEIWVREVWNSQFTETADLPDEYEDGVLRRIEVTNILEKATNLALKWIALSDQESNRSQDNNARRSLNDSGVAAGKSGGYWTTLTEKGVKYKSLIALLFYFLERGLKLEASHSERELCLRSASLYFVFLAVPGSGAFKIFDPVLYNKSMDTFKLALKLHLAQLSPAKKKKKKLHNKQKSSTQGSSQGSVKPRKRHGSRASSINSMQLDEDWEDSDDDINPGLLTPEEVESLTSSLNKTVFHFLVMLDHCSLKRSAEALETSVQELVDLTHLETIYANLDFGHKQRRSGLSAIAFNAYIGLEKLCAPLHGQVGRTITLVFKFLLPGVLMIHRGSSEIAPRGLAVIREHTLHFVKHLLSRIGPDSHEAAMIFIQHLALQVPERAEPRQKASQAIVDLMRGLPGPLFKKIVRWFFHWAHDEKVSHRQFSVEVMGRLLQENERVPDSLETIPEEEEGDREKEAASNDAAGDPLRNGEEELEGEQARDGAAAEEDEAGDRNGQKRTPRKDAAATSETNDDLVSHKFIFGVIFSRCRDAAPTVRAKALQTLAEITVSNNSTMTTVIKNMFSGEEREESTSARANGKRKSENGLIDFVDLLEESDDVDLASIDPLPSTKAFIDFLRKRTVDESVFVRKNALQVLENILKFSPDIMEEQEGGLISILVDHCRDSSLMVRKQMVGSLTELVKKYPDNELVIKSWVEGVFPLILDVEQKSAEKVLECVWECLFKNLVKVSAANRVVHDLPWKIMYQTQRLMMTKYLSRACATWAKEGKLEPNILGILKTHVSTVNNDHAWLLLSLVTAHLPLLDPHFVMDYFNTSIHTPEGVGLYTLLQVLRVLFASVVRLSRNEQKLLQHDLILLVKRFAIPPELISTAVDIATVVCHIEAGEGNTRQYQSNVDGWAVEIVETIDAELTEKILKPSGHEVEDTKMMRQIFTLGELAQVCPTRINNRLFLLMQSIIFQQGSKHRRKKTLQSVPDEQADIPSSQTQSTQPPPCAFTPTTRLQALAIVTLAKMCIQHDEMAKKIVPAFGRLLDTSNDVSIKINVMYALTDMCVRYASLVDPLIPQITACLKDPNLIARRTTLITLVHLLQEDYLKMSGRGAFFFRILQTLNDESEEIRHLTTFYVQQRLLKRQPKVMYQNFIEAIFHFNSYEGHQKYNKFNISEREKLLFSMKGPDNKENRTKVYKFMLENMNDEERFQTTFKLCQDVLNGVVEETVRLDENSYGLLQDTFVCLSSEEIKLASLKTKQDEDEGITEEDMMGALAVAAKKTIISQVVKKNVIENIIPIIIALKHKLEKEKSGLIDDLMTYLRDMMKDYKNEVKELLAADKQLASEIEFDLKKWEEEQKKIEARRETMIAEPSANAQRNEEVIRVFLETAVTAMKEKMQAERRMSMEEGSPIHPGIISAPPTPLQSFLESNHALDGDKLPDSLPLMLSPNVVLDNISGIHSRKRKRKVARKILEESEVEKEEDVQQLQPGSTEGPSESVKPVEEPPENLEKGPEELEEDAPSASASEGEKSKPDEAPENLEKEETESEDIQPQSTPAGSSLKQDQGPDILEKDEEVEAKKVHPAAPTGGEGSSEQQQAPPDEGAAKIAKKVSKKVKERWEQKNPNVRRAISTPNKDETMLASNVTFLERSHEVSAIPILSPPSATRKRRKKNEELPQRPADSSDVSFRFRRGRDKFEEMLKKDEMKQGSSSSRGASKAQASPVVKVPAKVPAKVVTENLNQSSRSSGRKRVKKN